MGKVEYPQGVGVLEQSTSLRNATAGKAEHQPFLKEALNKKIIKFLAFFKNYPIFGIAVFNCADCLQQYNISAVCNFIWCEMSFIDQIHRIERIDQLIRLKATGRPAELAQKLDISESQLYEILNIMKIELGGVILYSKSLQSYYYPRDIRFKCLFEEVSEPNI